MTTRAIRMPSSTHAFVEHLPTALLIDGAWVCGRAGRAFAVDDPATGEAVCSVADADAADALSALDACEQAQAAWAGSTPESRSTLLRRACALLEERSDLFAQVMTLEMGKPLSESRGEVGYAASFLSWASEQARRLYGRTMLLPDGSGHMSTSLGPVGICYLVTPWNFPLAMATRKVAPALAAGCTMILKPAELTPLTSLLFGQLLIDAGVPAGVVNVLPTSDAAGLSNALFADGRLRKLSFTGSTAVGKRLLAEAAGGVLRTSMELGGNAPFLVFDDADIDAAVEGAILAKFRNMGQACTAANRFLVHRDVEDRFTRRLVARTRALQVGSGFDPAVQIGPVISARARAGISRLVDQAAEMGATVLHGGRALDGPGYFFEPTVLKDAPPACGIHQEEIFGPVASVRSFADEEEAIAIANDTPYGLAAYVYSGSGKRIARVVRDLDVGMVGANTGLISNAAAPFGGVKQSGFGREGGEEGILEYLSMKYAKVAS
jgi:succinate-semialdehyde dehydrogenase/glutarate-semialdehyde dehydrogenase